jgi:hypothetical protein
LNCILSHMPLKRDMFGVCSHIFIDYTDHFTTERFSFICNEEKVISQCFLLSMFQIFEYSIPKIFELSIFNSFSTKMKNQSIVNIIQ